MLLGEDEGDSTCWQGGSWFCCRIQRYSFYHSQMVCYHGDSSQGSSLISTERSLTGRFDLVRAELLITRVGVSKCLLKIKELLLIVGHVFIKKPVRHKSRRGERSVS